MAYIWYPTTNGIVMCSGSIIDKNLILTALHCLERKETNYNLETAKQITTVEVGSQRKGKGQSFKIAKIIVKNVANGIADFAILKLDRDIKLNNRTTARITLKKYIPKFGEKLIVAGHGEHIVYGDRRFEKSYVIGETTVTKESTFCHPAPYAFCGLGGTTYGDSGGPVMILNKGKYYQVGTALRANQFENAAKNKISSFGEFLKIEPFCDFIERVSHQSVKCV